MATAEAVADFRQVQRDVVSLALAEIVGFWRTLDFDGDLIASIRALEAFLPDVVQAYGEIGAAAAADFYEDLRAESPAARSAYAAVLGEAIPVGKVRASTGWAVSPLFTRKDGLVVPNVPQALANVSQITDRFVKAAGRDTISVNVERDPARARFARVPSGATTCAFCLTLASRGAVYASQADAAMHKYHGDCDCVPTPIWEGDAYPSGYDPDALYQKYAGAVGDSNGSLTGPDGILSALRKREGIR